jgi:hypothetical protein
MGEGMNFIRLTNVTATGPGDVVYRVNIDHIIRYWRHLGGGSWVSVTNSDEDNTSVVAESPEAIDALIQTEKERIYARSR